MANKIRLARGTKANIEANKTSLLDYEIVYSTDGKEIGVKNEDGTITYFLNKEHTVAPATKTKITYNEQGLVTGGADLELADIPALPQDKITGLTTDLSDLQSNKLDKDFSALTNQASPSVTDVLAINRGTTVQKVTVGNLLSLVDTGIFITASVLPATGEPNKIYLVPSSEPETQNELDEFIWVDNAWEKIGAVSVDLSDYFNKTEINSMLNDKVDKNANITAGTHPKITYDAKGLVTGGSALIASDIPDLAISKITNLQTTLDTKLDADSIIDGGDIS